MSPQTAEALNHASQEIVSRALALLQTRAEEIKLLQLTERVLSNLARPQAGSDVATFDLAGLNETRELLDQAIYEVNESLMAEAQERLSDELCLWQLHLAQHDARITVDDLRRYCENGDQLIEAQALPALLRFYRGHSRIAQSQCKYDFLATWMFTLATDDQQRRLRFGREQIKNNLNRMFAVWGAGETPAAQNLAAIEQAIVMFDVFVAELYAFRKLSELLGSGLFRQIQQYKNCLGEAFYVPEVTAAAIECNVACLSAFSTLLGLEGAQFRCLSEKCSEIARIFCDTSARPEGQSERALRDILAKRNELNLAEGQQVEKLAQRLGLPGISAPILAEISMAAVDTRPAETDNTPGSEAGSNSLTQDFAICEPPPSAEEIRLAAATGKLAAPADEPAISAAAEVDEPLREIAAREENRILLAMWEQASPALQNLDLKMFLAPLAEEPDVIAQSAELTEVRRNALSLILSADHLLHHPVEAAGQDPADPMNRHKSALTETRAVSTALQVLVEQPTPAQPPTTDCLNYVASRLRETQQSLQQAIEQNEQARAQKERRQTAALQKASEKPQEAGHAAASLQKSLLTVAGRFKWLLAATLLLAMVGIGVQFIPESNQTSTPGATDVTIINPGSMPEGTYLKSARQRRALIVAIVTDQWAALSNDQRREKLQLWLTYGKGRGAAIITLMTAQGSPAGSATDERIIGEIEPNGN